MTVSHGKSFRRLLAQARTADQGEIRALIERILPRGEGGARVLRLKTDADRREAPLAIAAALATDAITGDEAEELKRQAVAERTQARRSFWDDTPPDLVALSPLERRRLGYGQRPGVLFPPWRDAAKSGPAIVNNNENTMTERSATRPLREPDTR
jgi:hypothetical protein